MGYSNSKADNNYRKIKFDKNNNVKFFAEKNNKDKSLKNYIGLAEIYDYKEFWKLMNSSKIFLFFKENFLG